MLSDALNHKLRNHGVLVYETKYAHIRTYSVMILKLVLPHSFHLFLLLSHSVCRATVGQFYQLQTSSVIIDVIW